MCIRDRGEHTEAPQKSARGKGARREKKGDAAAATDEKTGGRSARGTRGGRGGARGEKRGGKMVWQAKDDAQRADADQPAAETPAATTEEVVEAPATTEVTK